MQLWKTIIAKIAVEEGWSAEQLDYILAKREEMFEQAIAAEIEQRKGTPRCAP